MPKPTEPTKGSRPESKGATGSRRASSTAVARQATEKRPVTSAASAAMQRADELLRKMTIEEKAMQLSCVQRYLVTETRLKIPALFHDEALNGVVVPPDYSGIWYAEARQQVAATAEEVASLGLAAGMDVETPSIQAYGQVLVKAVESGKVPEPLLDESVRRVLRDKFALGLFDDPYVPEDAVAIREVASEGDDLSQRLAAESVTLLRNEKSLLPLSRDVRKVAVIGPHADSATIGFPHYSYPAGLKMLQFTASIGKFPMVGLDMGAVPLEGFDAMKAELEGVNADLEAYVKESYPAVSLAEAVPRLLPNAEVTAVAGTGVLPSQPTPIAGVRDGERQPELAVHVDLVALQQLYAADTATGVTLPAQQLIGFTRIDLEPGASETVAFEVPMSLLAYTGISGELVMEPGPVRVSAGSSSSDIRSIAELTVTGRTRVVRGEDRAFFPVATVGSERILWGEAAAPEAYRAQPSS